MIKHTKYNYKVYGFCLFILFPLLSINCLASKSTHKEGNDKLFHVITITEGLEHPWGMVFLPDNRILVTERPGQLRIINKGKLDPKPITGLPKIKAFGQGGLMDIALHPNYKENGWIYFTYAAVNRDGVGTEVARARLKDHRLIDLTIIFSLEKKTDSGHHFGGRIVFDKQNYLYLSIGDRGDRPRSQALDDHAGSIIRLHDDGRIPKDNPFINQPGKKPEIFSYGHRNPQGLTIHPDTGEIWSHEHGPQGGDELNIIHKQRNYGWPIITYGVNYGWGTKIGEGTHKPGMEQPDYYWVPSIAPSGFTIYNGDKFPQWKNNFFIGSLKFKLLVRLEMKDKKIIKEERYFKKKLGRIRDVRTGPDGYIYLLTDAGNGKLIRLEPSN